MSAVAVVDHFSSTKNITLSELALCSNVTNHGGPKHKGQAEVTDIF